MRIAAALLVSLLLACQPTAAAFADGYVIFDPSMTRAMLSQCSRGSPKAGEAGWMPGDLDIARLEAKLPAALALARPSDTEALKGAPAQWLRQYIGIVREGRRYIYGNFSPSYLANDGRQWRKHPIMVCDGGAGFFGAEYDVEKGMFSHLAFNGSA